VDDETWIECMETLLGLGFSARDEARWMRSMAEALLELGDGAGAEYIIREALRRDPLLPKTSRLRRALQV
jgi:Holliday junction resolvasome RuvABC DNA-binding subunit